VTLRPNRTVDPREVELKFHLPPGSRAALEVSPVFAASKPEQHHLESTYFDTPDSVLDRIGLTLRVRRCGGTRTQTVKSQANGRGVASNRGEWEWPIDQDAPDVGRLAQTPALAAAAAAVQGKLEPIFVTDVRRTTRLLHLDEDTVVEVAFDEGGIVAGMAREPVSELELELKGGPVGPMYRLAAQLQALAPLWISPESKSARGWRLRTGQTVGARFARTSRLTPGIQAAAGFHEMLGGTLGHLMGNIGPTLSGDSEALRQMRIAVRESRAVLQLFERHLDAAAAGRFMDGLRRFGRSAGAARDWDVFCLETLPAAMPDLSAERLEDLNAAAEVERQFAHEAVADALRGRDFTAMVVGLAAWAEAGARAPSSFGDPRMGERLGTLAPSLLDRAAGRAMQRGRHASRLSVVQRHSLRKSLKKLCFDVQSLAGLYRARAVKAYCVRCEALEEILGVTNDAAATKRLALSLVTVGRPDLAKPAGALALWSGRRGRDALQGLKPALNAFRAAPTFWS